MPFNLTIVKEQDSEKWEDHYVGYTPLLRVR